MLSWHLGAKNSFYCDDDHENSEQQQLNGTGTSSEARHDVGAVSAVHLNPAGALVIVELPIAGCRSRRLLPGRSSRGQGGRVSGGCGRRGGGGVGVGVEVLRDALGVRLAVGDLLVTVVLAVKITMMCNTVPMSCLASAVAANLEPTCKGNSSPSNRRQMLAGSNLPGTSSSNNGDNYFGNHNSVHGQCNSKHPARLLLRATSSRTRHQQLRQQPLKHHHHH